MARLKSRRTLLKASSTVLERLRQAGSRAAALRATRSSARDGRALRPVPQSATLDKTSGAAGPARLVLPRRRSGLCLVDHDRAAGDRLWIGHVHVGRRAVLVVEDTAVPGVAARDQDPEFIAPPPAGHVAVVGRQREVVAGDAVYRPGALVLGLVAGDDEPVVTLAVE